MKFLHIIKVHSIPPGNQCQWHKYCRHYCQKIHNSILLQGNLGLINFTDLLSILFHLRGILMQTLSSMNITLPTHFFILDFISVHIKLHMLTHIGHLIIRNHQFRKMFPILHNSFIQMFLDMSNYIFFDFLQLFFNLLHSVHIIINQIV